MPATPSLASVRNAAIRAALAQAFPGTRFTVRNGRSFAAAVLWTDGPTQDAVGRVVRSVPSSVGEYWAHHLGREESNELLAVAFLRAHAADPNFYRERDENSPSSGNELARWTNPSRTMDASTITADERDQAKLVLALAVNDREWRTSRPARALARTVFLHADTIRTATAWDVPAGHREIRWPASWWTYPPTAV